MSEGMANTDNTQAIARTALEVAQELAKQLAGIRAALLRGDCEHALEFSVRVGQRS